MKKNNTATTTPVGNIDTENLEVLFEEDTKTLEEKHPTAFYVFGLAIFFAVFSLIILFGVSTSNLPWGILAACCAVLAAAIGLWLWGYYSHKPATIVKIRYVRVDTLAEVTGKAIVKSEKTKTEPQKDHKESSHRVPSNKKVNLEDLYSWFNTLPDSEEEPTQLLPNSNSKGLPNSDKEME